MSTHIIIKMYINNMKSCKNYIIYRKTIRYIIFEKK